MSAEFETGTWYRSAVSGLWYRNKRAAGDIDAIKEDGVVREVDIPAPAAHPRRSRLLAHTAALMAMADIPDIPGFNLAGPSRYRLRAPDIRTCALPGCEQPTDHRGGYCCAEHCKEHKLRQRRARGKETSEAD